MNFRFNLFNHSALGQRSLDDPMSLIGRQLQALGHGVQWRNEEFLVGEGNFNILFEGFFAGHINKMQQGHAAGCRFIIVATEEPTDKGFNHGLNRAMVARQANFPRAAALADAIWCLVPGTEAWYGQHARTSRLELGYSPRMVRAQTVEPMADFGFFGSRSRRRREILRRLERHGAVVGVYHFPPAPQRDAAMMQARVMLQLRAHEKMGLVSSSRCAVGLLLGRPVVAEPHALSHPWDQVIRFSASDESLIAEAVAVRATWRSVHAEQMEKFKILFSPERCVGAALRSCGLASSQAAA